MNSPRNSNCFHSHFVSLFKVAQRISYKNTIFFFDVVLLLYQIKFFYFIF